MILFPNCKVNLGLHITGKRADGFHDLETVFYPVPLYDAAEIVINEGGKLPFHLEISGLQVTGSMEDNLCYRAWKLINDDIRGLPPLKMYLHKAIPTGAGLGGGSSDGAFTLSLINELLNLKIEKSRLLRYALQLGSDCPFFLLNKPCRATGRGENMTEIPLQLHDHYFVLVHPNIHVNTGWAFDEIDRLSGQIQNQNGSKLDIITTITQPVADWKNVLANDFEDVVFPMYPGLQTIKRQLYDAGAEYASLTGSGSCVYGLFSKGTKAARIKHEPGTTVYILNDRS